jgi:Ca2+-binding RTX toxin-like protein
MSTITLTSDYSYSPYKATNLSAGSTINATNASWIVSNQGSQTNTYPFQVVGAGTGLTILGGHIYGQVSQTGDWRETYINSAAVRFADAPGAVIKNWWIDKPWDGIRPNGSSQNFLIEDVYISNARDDAIENDDALSGTVRDSLFDGVFSGVSTSDGDFNGASNTMTMDGMLLRMKSYSYEGRITHGSPFKLQYNDNTGGNETNPHLKFVNNLVAIEVIEHIGMGRLEHAWERMTSDSTGNVYLNLSDKPFPADYPLPKFGWTILQGQAARDYWNKAKSAWLDAHDSTPDTAPAPTPVPIEPTPITSTTINGTSGSDKLTGTSRSEIIDGLAGSDTIWGKGGADVLKGGSGKDIFVFDTSSGAGNVNRISDFNVLDDTIYLDNAIFSKLGSGSMSSPKKISSGYFEIDDRADESNDFLLYNKDTGSLMYDADANQSGAAIEIAKLAAGLSLTSSDIYII